MRETAKAAGSHVIPDSAVAATPENSPGNAVLLNTPAAALIDLLPDAAFLYDRSGRIVRTNPAMRRLFALDSVPDCDTASFEQRIALLVPRDLDGRPLPKKDWHITRLLCGETINSTEPALVCITSFDGRECQLSVTGTPVCGEHGDILGAVCIMHDVTERRRLERRTRDALAALFAIAEAAVTIPAVEVLPTIAAEGSSDTTARKLAALARQVIGCTRVAIICLDEMQRLVPIAITGGTRDEERQWRAMLRDVPLARVLEQEQISRLRDGEVFALDTALPPQRKAPFAATAALLAPMRIDTRLLGMLSLGPSSGNGKYSGDDQVLAAAVAQLVGLVVDRERLLRDRAAAQSRALALEETNHLMSEFLGIAGHELRTPLTSIRANAQLALRTLRTSEASPRDPAATLERLHPLIARIEHQSHRQERLVNDLLDVSRIEAGRLELHAEPADLATIVRECVEEHRLLYPERTIALTLPAGAHPVPIVADADRIGQVLTNYLTNALKYSTEDSPVTVRLRIHGGCPQVRVGDSGPGLPPEERTRVWERFHRAPGVEVQSGSGIGLGLGLFISKMIVERHGGTVGVQSRPGQGSVFWFTLPLAQGEYGHWPE